MTIRVRLVTAVAASALLLSGCAAPNQPNPYATATAADLQQSVLHVTEAAGDGDLAAALTRLHELEVSTKVAHARGELTLARQDSILSAIALVRADLEAMIAEAKRKAEAKQKAEEEAKRKAEEEARKQAEAERQAEEDAARRAAEEEAQRVAAEQAASEQRDQQSGGSSSDDGGDDDGGDDDRGKGKGKGKGGKGKGGDD